MRGMSDAEGRPGLDPEHQRPHPATQVVMRFVS
jgi:hypothetical protein